MTRLRLYTLRNWLPPPFAAVPFAPIASLFPLVKLSLVPSALDLPPVLNIVLDGVYCVSLAIRHHSQC